MSSPGGKNIARVSVRVLPDTSGFKAKVEEQLRQLRDGTIKVNIIFVVDRKKLQTQLKAAEAGLSIRVPVNFDVQGGELAAAKVAAKKPLKVPVNFDVDPAGVARAKAALAAILANTKNAKIKAELDLKTAQASLEKALAGIKPVHIRAVVDVQESLLQKTLAGIKPVKIRATLDLGGTGPEKFVASFRNNLKQLRGEFTTLKQIGQVVSGSIGNSFVRAGSRIGSAFTPHLKSIQNEFRRLRSFVSPITDLIGSGFSSAARVASTALSGLGSIGSTVFGGLASAASGIAGAFSIAAGPIGAVVQAGLGLAKVAGLATLVAEAGAGISAAWAFASTAIAAVPAAIGLIGVPIAAVLVGMDGIKKAFKSIKPEVDKLQKSVSAAFEKGLTPVLKQLANVLFPKLAVGLSATATALSGVAAQTVNWLTSQPGIALLSTTIGNINTAISQINLVPLLDGFLKLAGNKAALDALVLTVNGLGTSLQAIADMGPVLDQAFTGLGQVLGAVERAFTGLIQNGIKAFATAAPGMTAALDSITNFFGKFDYARLGKAIGDAFKGISTAIDGIPPATVEAITTAFERLGTTLNSPAFKAGFQSLIDLMPKVIDAITFAVNAISGFLFVLDHPLQSAGFAFTNTLARITDALGITTGATDRSNAEFQKLAGVGPQFDDLQRRTQGAGLAATITGGQFADFAKSVLTSGGNLADFGLQVQNGVVVPLEQLPAKADVALAKLPLVTKKQMSATVKQINSVIGPGGTMVAGFGTGFRQLSPIMQQELGILGPQSKTDLEPLPQNVAAATQAMADAANAAIPGLGTAFQTGFAALGPLIDTAFATLNTTNIPTAMLAMGTAITAGITTSIGPAFTLGFASLGPVIDTAFATLSAVSIASGFIVMGAAFTAGFLTNIGPAFTAGFLTLGPVVDTAFATLSATSIATGFIVMGTAFVAGFLTNIVPAINSGFVLVNTAFTTGFSTIATTSVTPGMVAVAAAVTAGFLGVIAAVTDGMNAAVVSANVGFTDLNTSAVTGMATFTESIKAGAANVIAEVTSMVDAAIQEANKLEAGFKAAGANAVAAMAAAIRAGQNEVVNAARETVQAANAAAQNAAKINSPSRVWYGFGTGMIEGAVGGLHDDTPKFEAAARKSVVSAMVAAQAEVDTGTKLNLAAAFTQATGTLAAKVSTELTATKAPVLLATIQNIMDGKVLDERTQTLITSWERELLSAHRAA